MAASDQIVFFQRKDHVKEESQYIVTATFRDRATVAEVTPTNVKYRIDCLTTGAQILDWTTASPSTSITITVTPTQNEMQDQCNECETREITVAADYGLSTQFLESITYELINTYGVT